MLKIQKLQKSKNQIKFLAQKGYDFNIGDLVCEKANENNHGIILALTDDDITVLLQKRVYDSVWDELSARAQQQLDDQVLGAL